MTQDILVLADEYAAAVVEYAKGIATGADSMSPLARDAGDKRMALAEAIAAARVQALEEAAIAADLFCNGGESQRPLKYPVADAIRALIEKEST